MDTSLAAPAAVLAYRHAAVAIHTCGLTLALAFPLALMIGRGWGALQRTLRVTICDRRLFLAAVSGAIYGTAWSLVSDGVQLALRLNRQTFGFEDQAWPGWLGERVGATVGLAAFSFVAAPLGFALILRSPRRWSLWSGLAIAVLLVSVIVVQPILARTRPLPAGPLRAEISRLLRKAGRPGTPVVLRPDSGPCVGGTNLGVFPTTRIVIDDGYLRGPTAQGVEVAAHELGHYVRHDPELGVLVGLLWLGVGMAVLS